MVDTALASLELGNENDKLDQRRLRLRHMANAPGRTGPRHSHEARAVDLTMGNIVNDKKPMTMEKMM